MITPTRKLALLTALYFVEGMPWGFQAKALPVFMRSHHASLSTIGLLNLLSLPWMLKALWAPLVDRYRSERFGARKSWIVPMQAAIALTCLAGATVAGRADLTAILCLVGLLNLFSATMDIAVDGLAVDLLGPGELGAGNTAQVVGYKFGTLASGGLLVWATASLGWPALFVAMGALSAVVCVVTLFFREAPRVAVGTVEQGAYRTPETVLSKPSPGSFVHIARTAIATLRVPGAGPFLLVVATYKTGEQLIDSMFKPFLVDEGYSPAQVGLWVSTFGMVASLAGSTLGGVLATRVPLVRAVTLAAVLRAIPIFGVFLLTLSHPSPSRVIAAALTENFFGGLLTTAMFALMMSRTDRRIGATHFTLLSTLEMLGKAPVPLLAGPIAQRYGYSVLFAAGTALSLLFLVFLVPLHRTSLSEGTNENHSTGIEKG